jgi:hypothetical protein
VGRTACALFRRCLAYGWSGRPLVVPVYSTVRTVVYVVFVLVCCTQVAGVRPLVHIRTASDLCAKLVEYRPLRGRAGTHGRVADESAIVCRLSCVLDCICGSVVARLLCRRFLVLCRSIGDVVYNWVVVIVQN